MNLSILLVALLAATGQKVGSPSPTSDVSNNRVTATGSSTARALKTHLATLPDSTVVATGQTAARKVQDVAADVLGVRQAAPRTSGTLTVDFTKGTHTIHSGSTASNGAVTLDSRGATKLTYDSATVANDWVGVDESGTWDLSDSDLFALDLGWDKAELRAQIQVYVRFNDNTYTDSASYGYWPGANHQPRHVLSIAKSAFSVTGTANWAAVTHIEVRLRRMTSAGSNTVYLYGFWSNVAAKAKVLITFDDAVDTAYTEAFPRMQALDMKGTMYVIGETVETSAADTMTVAQLQAMDTAGWDIGSHTWSHIHMTKAISSYTRSGTTATMVFSQAHGYSGGETIAIAGADVDAEYSGTRTVTVSDSTTITFPTANTEPETTARGWYYIVDGVDRSLLRSEVRRNQEWLRANGFVRGADHFAYPYGEWDLSVIQMLRDEFGYKTARGISNINAGAWVIPTTTGVGSPHMLPAWALNNVATATNALAQVDAAITQAGTIVFYAHGFVASSPTSTQMLISEFESFLAGLATRRDAGQIDVVTISEWYAQMGLADDPPQRFLAPPRVRMATSLVTTGAGDPEGIVAAEPGSMYLRTDGGSGATLYVKESGSGATGWAAK